MRFWKSYICSNKLDVQETNISFSQLNRIRDHLTGHWTETGWFACSGTMGSNCLFLEMFRVSDGSGKPESDVHKHHKPHKKVDVMKDIDAVPSNVQSARSRSFIVCV